MYLAFFFLGADGWGLLAGSADTQVGKRDDER
jgi:hypothetical protein